jgi:2-polyprenyl-3-methyl-5-hydroxy-6-metoxy-1,4-benzoquinol methylase
MEEKDNTADQEFLNNWWKIKGSNNKSPALKHFHVMSLISKHSFPLCDIGAGLGLFMRLLEGNWSDKKIFGVDGSNYAVLNKQCTSEIYFSDIRSWAPSEHVETVTMIDVLEHLPEPKKVLEHVKSYTNHLIIACPNFNFIKGRLEMLLGDIPFQNRIGRGGHVYWCNYYELRKMFSELSLEIVEECHMYPRRKNKLLGYFFSKFPAVFAHEFIFKLRLKRS